METVDVASQRPNNAGKTSAKPAFTRKEYLVVFIFVTSLFMLWGIAITMGDVLNRHFQKVLHISKAESGLVQFSIFGAYAVMGIPAGLFMKRFGYKNGVLLGLALYAIGAFLFIPSANAESFAAFRGALFVLACGLATLETVAHPFMAALGDQRTSDQRINFAQAFNGVGAIIGPFIGGYFILRVGHGELNDLTSVKVLYAIIGAFILLVAFSFSLVKVPPLADPHAEADGAEDLRHIQRSSKTLFQHKHFVWAVIAQFFNVAAQGGTWAFFIVYGAEKMPGMTDERASYFFGMSMFLMMIGRFIGVFLMRYITPNILLAAAAVGNIIMAVIVAQSAGWISFGALMMMNFFMSIMFPTIFSLGLKNLGKHTERGASFIVMGVVGGALFPPLMGLIADHDVAVSYYLPIICYIVIFFFGARFSKVE